MTLDQWLLEKDLSAEAFARQLSDDSRSCTGEAVRLWRKGARQPDAVMTEKIVAATDGQVTVEDLHKTRLSFLKANPGAAEGGGSA